MEPTPIQRNIIQEEGNTVVLAMPGSGKTFVLSEKIRRILAYIIHSGFISGYQNRYGDNLKPPTNVYHRMTA